jgi:hypothetical protein
LSALRTSALTATSINSNAETFEQTVYINAEFKDATDRTEIEAALDSLINRAAQYANRS